MEKILIILMGLFFSCQSSNSVLEEKYNDYLYALFEFQIEYNDAIKTDFIATRCENREVHFLKYSKLKALSNYRSLAFDKKNKQSLQEIKDGKIYSLDSFKGLDFSSNIWSNDLSVSFENGRKLFSVKKIEDNQRFDADNWNELKNKIESDQIQEYIDKNRELLRRQKSTYVASILTIEKGEIVDFHFYVW